MASWGITPASAHEAIVMIERHRMIGNRLTRRYQLSDSRLMQFLATKRPVIVMVNEDVEKGGLG